MQCWFQESYLILRQASKKLHVTFIVARNSTSVMSLLFCINIYVLIRYLASGLDKCTLVYAGHLPWVFKLTARFTTFVLYSLLAIVIKLNDTAN